MTLSPNGNHIDGACADDCCTEVASSCGSDRRLELKRGGFIASYPPFESLEAGGPEGIWDKQRLALYVHLPYCRKRCTFCFYKVYTNRAAKPMDAYLHALHQELNAYGARPELQGRQVDAVYFGGGTPTTLTIQQLQDLVVNIRKNFNISPDAEFTCESEPGTLNADKLACLRDLGVTRLSMGVQSFDDELLKKNGRSHGTDQVFRAIELARKNDFPVLNIDLMSGIVDETMETWERSVQKLIDLDIEHCSIYRMEVYKNSLLYAAGYTGPGVGGIPTDEEELQMWLRGVEMLEGAGYSQACGHAFIKEPKHDHIERIIMWSGEDFVGTGVSSYSYLDGTVTQNVAQWESYVEKAGSGEIPVHRWLRLNSQQRMAREVVLGMKLLSFDRERFRRRHGFDVMDLYEPQIEILVNNGLLEVSDEALTVTRRGRVYVEMMGSLFYLLEHADLAFHRFANEDELVASGAFDPAENLPRIGRRLELTPVG
jgi:oxygen-independent coproporphyrinogen III oxidase